MRKTHLRRVKNDAGRVQNSSVYTRTYGVHTAVTKCPRASRLKRACRAIPRRHRSERIGKEGGCTRTRCSRGGGDGGGGGDDIPRRRADEMNARDRGVVEWPARRPDEWSGRVRASREKFSLPPISVG